MDKDKQWIVRGKKEVFSSKIVKINELDCYLQSKQIVNNFYSMDLHDWVNVFCIDDENNVIMVKQHRMGANIVTIEVPAGAIDAGENPLTAAKRELEEETGYVTDDWISLKSIFVNPAIQTNTAHFFLARGCQKLKKTSFDSTEEIELVKMPLAEVLDARTTTTIENSVTLLCIMLAKDYLNSLK